MSGNKISGPYSKFCESDPLTPLTKGAEGPGGVHKDVQQELEIDFGTDQTSRPLVVNHPRSCTNSLAKELVGCGPRKNNCFISMSWNF